MTKYILECPECDARFELKKYVPDHRTRCRKCRSIMVIPRAPGDEAPPVETASRHLDPRIRKKLVRVFSLKKLSAVALLLCAALVGASYILVKRNEARMEPAPAPEATPALNLDDVYKRNRLLALPLKSGFTWEYALTPGGMERQKVGMAAVGNVEGPEFNLGVIGSTQAGAQTLRVRRDGVYLLAETREGERAMFKPPRMVVPDPIFTDSEWEYEGERVVEGGVARPFKLYFKVTLVEVLKTRAGSFVCFRVEIRARKEQEEPDEVRWYAKGVGLVKRVTRIPGGVEESVLTLFKQN